MQHRRDYREPSDVVDLVGRLERLVDRVTAELGREPRLGDAVILEPTHVEQPRVLFAGDQPVLAIVTDVRSGARYHLTGEEDWFAPRQAIEALQLAARWPVTASTGRPDDRSWRRRPLRMPSGPR